MEEYLQKIMPLVLDGLKPAAAAGANTSQAPRCMCIQMGKPWSWTR